MVHLKKSNKLFTRIIINHLNFLFLIVEFKSYIEAAWNENNPNYVPITPNKLSPTTSNSTPLKMVWALIVHKSQGLTLEITTIDINNIDHEGLTLIISSRVKLSCLCIDNGFTY